MTLITKPLFWLVGLYLLKTSLIKSTFDNVKVVMALSLAALASLANMNLQQPDHIRYIAIPICVVILGQAWVDYHFQFNTKQIQIKVFYCMMNKS